MKNKNEILIEEAPAKVNFFLNITERREDGYHEMDMINHSADLCDRLTLIPGAAQFSLDSNFETPDNLITKVVKTMGEIYDKETDFKIILEKQIPYQAGLGGGSSDAAAAIRLLERYWDLDLSEEERCALAVSFGADVPYCLYNRPAHVTGIGEKIEPVMLSLPPYLLILKPSVNIETREAFGWVDESPGAFSEQVQNTFYPFVAERYPVVRELREKLEGLGAETAIMSGSGSTLVGYFKEEEERDRAYENLKGLDDISLFKARVLGQETPTIPEV